MLPKTHIIVGFIASLLIFMIFPSIGWFYSLIIFLSSFLIDFDHYLYYAIIKKDYNPRRAVRWFFHYVEEMKKLSLEEREKYKMAIIIFHGIECWILLILLVFVHKIFLFVLIGIAIHMTLDFIDLFQRKKSLLYKISQVFVHRDNKGKKDYFL